MAFAVARRFGRGIYFARELGDFLEEGAFGLTMMASGTGSRVAREQVNKTEITLDLYLTESHHSY